MNSLLRFLLIGGAAQVSSAIADFASALRHALPVWFVAFGDDKRWADNIARSASGYSHMGVTYSSVGEYGNAIDLLRPISPAVLKVRNSAASASPDAQPSSIPVAKSLAQATPGMAHKPGSQRDE
jgi:hypothetical protein